MVAPPEQTSVVDSRPAGRAGGRVDAQPGRTGNAARCSAQAALGRGRSGAQAEEARLCARADVGAESIHARERTGATVTATGIPSAGVAAALVARHRVPAAAWSPVLRDRRRRAWHRRHCCTRRRESGGGSHVSRSGISYHTGETTSGFLWPTREPMQRAVGDLRTTVLEYHQDLGQAQAALVAVVRLEPGSDLVRVRRQRCLLDATTSFGPGRNLARTSAASCESGS